MIPVDISGLDNFIGDIIITYNEGDITKYSIHEKDSHNINLVLTDNYLKDYGYIFEEFDK